MISSIYEIKQDGKLNNNGNKYKQIKGNKLKLKNKKKKKIKY